MVPLHEPAIHQIAALLRPFRIADDVRFTVLYSLASCKSARIVYYCDFTGRVRYVCIAASTEWTTRDNEKSVEHEVAFHFESE